MTYFLRAFLLLFGLLMAACSDPVHKIEGVSGPTHISEINTYEPASPEMFQQGHDSRLAILLTDHQSHWLSLARGLKTMGVPFRMTEDPQDAFRHDVVLVYPIISGRTMDAATLRSLTEYVETGGHVIASNVLGGGLQNLFGITGVQESKSHYRLQFEPGFAETGAFESKGLAKIKIGSKDHIDDNIGTNIYRGANRALAVYENGDTAITYNEFGTGKSFALGVDIGHLLSKGYSQRQVDISKNYVNTYQPTTDALLIFIKNIYRQNQAGAVTIGTVPDGQKLNFILTHDIDYSESLRNALPYAKYQADQGISGTYFVQTKYVKDYNDKAFFNETGIETLTALEGFGAEIGSHSVSHAKGMWTFPLGNGRETYPEYAPFVQTAETTRNGTTLGELRVSKFLLDHFLKASSVQSFRPGFLSNPYHLPQALDVTGYQYSSSATANEALTHFPYQLTVDRKFERLTPVFEFPITIEDEEKPPMFSRVESAKTIARQIAQIGGLYIVLTHTDDVDERLEFQKQMIDEVRPYAWTGSLREFGAWWVARDKVSIDVSETDERLIIELHAPSPIEGLTLELTKAYSGLELLPSDAGVKIDGNYLTLRRFEGVALIEFAK